MRSPYVVHSSAARRRRIRRRKGALAAAAVVVLLALGRNRVGDDWPARDGTVAARSPAAASPLGSQDGYVAVGASLSPFSDEPAVAELDPALREAVREAANDALADGIALRVNGGWRSARYQRELLRRAVQTYGSVEAAREYVKPPGQSSHVTGDAVDVGPADAASWLAQRSTEYGLCRTYANEPWHFELATVPGGACPPMNGSAADDFH